MECWDFRVSDQLVGTLGLIASEKGKESKVRTPSDFCPGVGAGARGLNLPHREPGCSTPADFTYWDSGNQVPPLKS